MSTGGTVAVVAAAGALVLAAVPAAAAGPVVVTEALELTQTERMCGGEEVPVRYAGEIRTTSLDTGSGAAGWSSRFRADLSWEQQGRTYEARMTGQFAVQPGGRTSTYRFVANGRDSSGGRVHLLEVVHARWAEDEVPEVLVEVERISCR